MGFSIDVRHPISLTKHILNFLHNYLLRFYTRKHAQSQNIRTIQERNFV